MLILILENKFRVLLYLKFLINYKKIGKNIMAKIICAFLGLGKTYLAKNYNNIIDHDITKYKYIKNVNR